MMETQFKIGDQIRLKASKNGEVVIVEQVMARGKTPYYLCSWRDQSWTPIMYSHEYVEKVQTAQPFTMKIAGNKVETGASIDGLGA